MDSSLEISLSVGRDLSNSKLKIVFNVVVFVVVFWNTIRLVTETIDEVIDFCDNLGRTIVACSSLLFFIGSSECITTANINFNILGDNHFALNLNNSSLVFFRVDKGVRVRDDFSFLVSKVVVDSHLQQLINYKSGDL